MLAIELDRLRRLGDKCYMKQLLKELRRICTATLSRAPKYLTLKRRPTFRFKKFSRSTFTLITQMAVLLSAIAYLSDRGVQLYDSTIGRRDHEYAILSHLDAGTQ